MYGKATISSLTCTRHVICLLLLMAASTEELQHSESICSLDGLGVMWRFGFWVVKERSALSCYSWKKQKTKVNTI